MADGNQKTVVKIQLKMPSLLFGKVHHKKKTAWGKGTNLDMTVLCWQLLGADRSYCLLLPDDCHWNNPFLSLPGPCPASRPSVLDILKTDILEDDSHDFQWVIRYPPTQIWVGECELTFCGMIFFDDKGPERPLLFWMFYFEKIPKSFPDQRLVHVQLWLLWCLTRRIPRLFFKLKTENTRSSDKNESKCNSRKRQISPHLLFVKPTSKTLATPMIEVIPPPCWRYLFLPHPQKEAQTKRRQHCRRMCQGSPIEHLVVHRGFLSQLISKGTDWFGTFGPCAKLYKILYDIAQADLMGRSF